MSIVNETIYGQFANGQSPRDSRVCLDAAGLETQRMEVIDNVGDFLRFVEISRERMESNNGGCF